MAFVYSTVDAFPPKSPVMFFPSAIVWIVNQYIAACKKDSAHRQGSFLDLGSMIIEVHMSAGRCVNALLTSVTFIDKP